MGLSITMATQAVPTSSRWQRGLGRALLGLAGLALALAATAQNYHFRAKPAAPSVAIDAGVLSAEERAFIAALPEVRVAVPLPPSRPYELISADAEISGIHPDMLLALAQTFGLRLRPVVLPDWSSTLAAVRRREVDIVMTLGVTTERMDYLAFTLGATPLPGALFARVGAKVDPASARFAIERNYMVNDWVHRQYPAATVLTVDTTPDALRAVASGQADVYLGSLLEATSWLQQSPLPGIEINRILNYGTGFYHFGVRKDWAPLAAILNKGIQTLRTSNTAELAAALGGLPPGAKPLTLLRVPTEDAALLAARPVWTVGAVRGLEALNDIDERGLHSGIAAEYTEQVARRLGVGIQVRAFDSVAAMLDALRRREIDIVPFLTQTPQRATEFNFSKPYVEMPYMLVARSDGPMYWNLDSLRGKRLALAAQHPLRETLARDYPDIRVIDAANGNQAMDLVEQGQADAAVEVKLFANLRINGNSALPLRSVAEVSELPAQFHFASARSGPALLPLVDLALADIPADEHKRMLRRWIAIDLQPGFPWQRYAPAIGVTLSALLLLAGAMAWWMRRLQREVAARRRSEALLTDIATTVPGVAFRYVLGADGSIRHHYFTPGAQAFLGIDLQADRTVLDTVAPRLEPADRALAYRLQAESLRQGSRFKVTCRYAHPDGHERWLHVEAVPTRSVGGQPAWTGYIVDVSTERELQARLAKEAESRNLMLASASHELRAPTHTLSLALQAMSREGLDEAQRGALKIVESASRMLANLLNDVLDAARPAHEPLRLRPRTFDLPQMLDDLGGAWRSAARTKGLGFELFLAPDLPRSVTLDALRLKQLLTNLLSNACKYTHQGQVALRAERLPSGGLRFVVSDTGIGIAPAEQARVFLPFVMLDKPAGHSPGEASSGLGLATCRRIATLMGGTIELTSAPGSGTQVSLFLPLPVSSAEQPATQGSLLVCDDDEVSRLLMARMLQREGFEVVETGDARQALQRWREGGIRALVTDLDLPGMNGLALIRCIREEAAVRGLPTVVIICSGSPVPELDDEDSVTGHDAYIVKPVSIEVLAQTLRRLGIAPQA